MSTQGKVLQCTSVKGGVRKHLIRPNCSVYLIFCARLTVVALQLFERATKIMSSAEGCHLLSKSSFFPLFAFIKQEDAVIVSNMAAFALLCVAQRSFPEASQFMLCIWILINLHTHTHTHTRLCVWLDRVFCSRSFRAWFILQPTYFFIYWYLVRSGLHVKSVHIYHNRWLCCFQKRYACSILD